MNLFTICSKNYLSRALLFCESALRQNTSIDVCIFMTDIVPLDQTIIKNIQKQKIQIYFINELDIPEQYLSDIISKYNITELSTAIKPFCFKKLFSFKKKYVIYFDPDIEIFNTLSPIYHILKTNNAIVTPHMCSPLPDDNYYPKNQDILLSGIFNFGFLALKKNNQTEVFLDWWSNQLLDLCFNDLDNGLFTDQKIGTFIITFISSTYVSNNFGWNVAYWNLHERKLSKKNNKVIVNNKFPLVFFHYSGLDLNNLQKLSNHQNRYKSNISSVIKKILKDYALQNIAIVKKYELNNLTNDFQLLDNDKKVNQLYRTALRISKNSFKYNSQGKLIFNKSLLYKKQKLNISLSINHKVEVNCEPVIGAVIFLRKDLLQLFNINFNQYPSDYYNWFVNGGYKDFDLDHHGFNNEKIKNDHFLKKNTIHFLKKITPLTMKARVKYYLNKYRRKNNDLPITNIKLETINDYNIRFEAISANNFFENASINYFGYFEYASGLSTAARNLCNLFSSIKILSNYQCLETQNKSKILSFEPKVYKKNKRVINFYHCNLDMIEYHLAPKENDSDINILYCVWELPSFPPEWIANIQDIDLIITPSQFVSANLLKSWGAHSYVLPHLIEMNPSTFKISNNVLNKYKIRKNTLKILLSLDFDSYLNRKNPLTALLAIQKLQSEKKLPKQILFILKTNDKTKTLKFLKDNSLKINNLLIIANDLSNEENFALKNIADIFISTHRSEGFGLNIAEMMFSKKIVIATNYSSNLDFCNTENSFLIDYEYQELKDGDYPFYENQIWANPNVFHTESVLFEVIKNFGKLENIRKNAYQTISEMNKEVLSFISQSNKENFKHIHIY